jgi:hypothetical protein
MVSLASAVQRQPPLASDGGRLRDLTHGIKTSRNWIWAEKGGWFPPGGGGGSGTKLQSSLVSTANERPAWGRGDVGGTGGGGGRGGAGKHMFQNRTGNPPLLEALMKNIYKIYSQLLLLGPSLANIPVCK